jgi:hypothetical protein
MWYIPHTDFFMEKILLYIEQTGKKNILLYATEKELTELLPPDEMIDNGTVSNIDKIKERWQISKVTKTNNKLTIDFKLLLRKK